LCKQLAKIYVYEFWFRKMFKKSRFQSKMYIGSTFENDIKELYPRKAYKYLGTKESFDIQHKNEKEKLKQEY